MVVIVSPSNTCDTGWAVFAIARWYQLQCLDNHRITCIKSERMVYSEYMKGQTDIWKFPHYRLDMAWPESCFQIETPFQTISENPRQFGRPIQRKSVNCTNISSNLSASYNPGFATVPAVRLTGKPTDKFEWWMGLDLRIRIWPPFAALKACWPWDMKEWLGATQWLYGRSTTIKSEESYPSTMYQRIMKWPNQWFTFMSHAGHPIPRDAYKLRLTRVTR